MSIITLSNDWMLIDRLQYWFESHAATQRLIWSNQVPVIDQVPSDLELLIVDTRLTVALGASVDLYKLVQSHPAIWLTYPEHSQRLDPRLERLGYSIPGPDLTRETLAFARERAIGLHEQSLTPEADGPSIDRRVAKLLQQWSQPIEQEVSGLKQTLSWLRKSQQADNAGPGDAQGQGLPNEIMAIRKRTEHLSRQLTKVRDLCSLLSSRFSVYRAPFCIATLVREVVSKQPGLSFESQLPRLDEAPDQSLAFADAGQIRSCLQETLAAVINGSTADQTVELALDHSTGQFRIIVWDKDTLDSESFHRLRDRWLGSQWSVSTAEASFLLGLGLTRERLRHNGGDLRVVRQVGEGVGLELSVPVSNLNAILSNHQTLLRNKLPQLSQVTQFIAKATPEQFTAATRNLVSDFLQRHLGSLSIAIPLENRHWGIVAPIEEAERDSFFEWLSSQWQEYSATQPSQRGQVLGSAQLEFTSLASVDVDTPVEHLVANLEEWLQKSLCHEVITLSDDVSEDNRRLQQITPDVHGPKSRDSVATSPASMGPSRRTTVSTH